MANILDILRQFPQQVPGDVPVGTRWDAPRPQPDPYSTPGTPEYKSGEVQTAFNPIAELVGLLSGSAVARGAEPLMSEIGGGPGIHELVNARESLYHFTRPEFVESILEKGINVSHSKDRLADLGDYRKFVSTSRVPSWYFQSSSRPVAFVIDPKKLPKATRLPYTDPGYSFPGTVQDEFEEAILNKVPPEAFKGVLLDRSAIRHENLVSILSKLQEKGVPAKIFDSQKEFQSYRAGISQEPHKLWAMLATLFGASAASRGRE